MTKISSLRETKQSLALNLVIKTKSLNQFSIKTHYIILKIKDFGMESTHARE